MMSSLSSIAFPVDYLNVELTDADEEILAIERDRLLPRPEGGDPVVVPFRGEGALRALGRLADLFDMLEGGRYADILRSDVASDVFGDVGGGDRSSSGRDGESMTDRIKRRVLGRFSGDATPSDAVVRCVELEVIGIASLDLFLQLNYTGPSMDRGLKPEEEGGEGWGGGQRHPLDGIHPHGMFRSLASLGENEGPPARADRRGSPSSPAAVGAPPPTAGDRRVRSLRETNTTDRFHDAVLAELCVDGEWPYQVCVAPYLLLLGRAVLSALAEPARPFRSWSPQGGGADGAGEDAGAAPPPTPAGGGPGASASSSSSGMCPAGGALFSACAGRLSCASLWSARAIVAHRRLISTGRDDGEGGACPSLWAEAEAAYARCLSVLRGGGGATPARDGGRRGAHVAAAVTLEWGLAQHHFRKPGRGKASFVEALEVSGLDVEVTGAIGKRTRYQQKATAQYLVRAKPSSRNAVPDPESRDSPSKKDANVESQMIKHDDVCDDALLLERIKFEEQRDNEHHTLSILDQSILLALCLDVKNDNPMDGLTGEQMGAYLARVLNQHDDWMVYATALLERAWLECERTHGRERAILQIQALADQHSNRLTLTQSTFKSVEEDSAPVQDRLRNLHSIVYPPRWEVLRDLAERYAKLGVVTSAAEIFEQIELWDEVVECYRIAGNEGRALATVRTRLAERETPRMCAALGGLTNDPKYFERALELSDGKFYDAHVALGKLHFDRGDLRKSLAHYRAGLAIKPLMPAVWFRVGTICMHLGEWDAALRSFTEVVQQEPEEGDAWANVAAIHMHRKNPTEAYPALLEVSHNVIACLFQKEARHAKVWPSAQSLKQNRNNWRVWVSKLYTCIDLRKWDEAILTCTELLNLKARTNSSADIPMPEEKVIRAILGGSLQNYRNAHASGDKIALDSSRRTLARARQLLDKLKSSMKSEVWLYEVSARFNEEMGLTEDVYEDLMKKYRTLQTIKGWEDDPVSISKMTSLLKEIYAFHKATGIKEGLVKCKLLINGIAKKLRCANCDSELPKEVAVLDAMLSDLDHSMASYN
jgi:tetratricopeptide (TPR) repeat protein